MSDNRAQEQAIIQAKSIARMVAATEVDYDRLEELRNERDNFVSDEVGNLASDEVHKIVWTQTFSDDAEELASLEEAAGDYTSQEQAEDAIREDALDVQVRSDWYIPCHPDSNESKPSEFYILLCAGGPAVRIMGELDQYSQPCRAWIEYQDWGTPWTQLFGEIEQSTLLAYCGYYWFGE